jgi:hypothetical protein
MLRTAPRALGPLAVVACAGMLATCTNEASGPGRRGVFAVEPVLPAGLNLSAFNLVVDNVRLIVVRPPTDTVYDQTVSFPANQNTLQLQADIPLNQSPESFDVTVQELSGSTLLFSGTQTMSVSEGSTNTPVQVPLAYSGPGQNIATLTIDPPDSMLTWDGTLAFRTTALDAQQSPVTSYYLSWSTSDATVPIDVTGHVTATHVRTTVTVTATTPTNISAATTLTLVPSPSAITIVSGCGQSAAPGTPLSQPVIAKVIATDNGGVQGVTVTFTPPAGGSAVPAQVVTDANGLAQTTLTLGPAPGPQALTIGAPGLTSVPCAQTATGVATHLAFTTEPSNVAAGSPITPAVVVTALDANNQPVASFTGTVTIGIGNNPGNSTLGGTLNVAAVAGSATFNNLTLNVPASGYTLAATATGLTGATSAAFNVVNASSTHLVFTTQPSNVVAGAVITPAIVVTAEDALNNPVTSFTASVTLSFGTCPIGATLFGTPTVAATAGVATFNDISIDKAGGCTLVASSASLQSVASSSFTVSAGAKAKLAFSVQPTSVVAGAVINPVVAVNIEDALGNTVPSATDNITVAIGTNPGSATLGGALTKPAASGIALFTDLTLNKTGTGYTLTAASGTLTGATSATFNVTAGAAASVVKISGDNQTGAGGAALAQPLVVEVRDSLANPVPGVTVSWATPSGGSLAPPSGPTGTNGQAQATWTLGPSAPSQTATATVGALTPASFSATATIGTPAISLSFAGVPGVGIGLSAKVYVDLNQAAPAGGTPITLVSGNQTIFTVAPTSLTIPQGKTRDSVNVMGVAAGQNTLTATSSGFNDGTLTVVVQNRNISVPPTLNVPYGQTASLPIQLPAAAPAGGVSFTVVSSAPGFVSVASSPVTIVAGGQTVNATLNGVLPGPATITVSNPAYVDGVTNATTTASLDITQTSTSLNASFGTSISINFVSNGVPAAAPAPGISVTFNANDPTCVSAAGVTIPQGLVSTTANLVYGGSATLPCTTKLFAQATNLQTDSITVTVNPIPTITVGAVTVGSGLQVNTSFTLGAANHGGVSVQLTSSDPGVLLAPDATTAGQNQITVPVANGTQTVGFYVQGLEGRTTDTVHATVTATAPGFTNGTAIETSQQAAIDLQGIPTSTTTLSASSFAYARLGIANSINSALNQLQAVRAGAPGPLTVTFTTPPDGVGELLKKATAPAVTQTATIAIGQFNSPTDTTSGGVAFRPLVAGNTTVGATIPGFIATTAASRPIAVTQPGITVGSVTVGSGLQVNTSFTLGAPNHGNITVQLSSDTSGVLLSPDAVTPGQQTINIPVLDGVTTVGFYVQGAEGRTTDTVHATVTVSAPGFTNGTAIETSQQAAIDLQGIPASTTTLSAASFAYARVGIANSNNTALNQLQNVRAGAPGPLTVTFTVPPDGVGELLKTGSSPGVTQTAAIPIGQANSPTDTTTGGVAFHPLTSGSTTVSAAVTGFISTNAASRQISVSAPGITVGSVTVGSGLQVNTSFTLGASNHGGVTVQLSSSDPGVLLSPNATTAGQTVISIPVANGTTTVGFYVQGAEGRTTDTVHATVTVSAPGFTDGTAIETSQQAAIDLQGLPTTTTTLSPVNFVYARTGIANANNTALNQLQNVRAGGPGALTVTFTTPSNGLGELLKQGTGSNVTQTASIPIGQANSPTDTTTGGVAFHALLSGTTTVAATIPGYISTSAATRSIDVSQPGITVGSVTVGSGLQVNTSFTLGASNHGALTVTIASSNGAALVSPDVSTAGTSQITIPVANGVTTVGFYVQGNEGQTGTPTITVSASGFTNGTGTATVVQPALDLQGLPTQTTPLTPSSFIYARIGVANGQNSALNQLQAVRAGAPGPLTVTFTTPANGIGELLKQAVPAGATQTATIAIGQFNTPTDTTSGGVAFHPLAGLGPTTVSATIPGYVATSAATRTITNQTPSITVGSVTVGSGLQVQTSFTLGAPNHGNFSVTLTSDNPNILLAPDAVTPGQPTISMAVADQVQTVAFYVQGLEGLSSAVTGNVTVSATGFTDGLASQTAVQAALDLQGVPSTMTVGGADASIYVRVGTPSSGNAALNQLEAVRAGAPGPLTVSFTSDNTAAATLVNSSGGTGSPQTIQIPSGQFSTPTSIGTGGVAVRSVSAGVAHIAGAVSGLITTTTGTRQVTVQ